MSMREDLNKAQQEVRELRNELHKALRDKEYKGRSIESWFQRSMKYEHYCRRIWEELGKVPSQGGLVDEVLALKNRAERAEAELHQMKVRYEQ